MTLSAKFEIEAVSSVTGQGYLVMARRLDEVEFWINGSTRLDGAAVRHGDIPRALDQHGKPRLDLWGFFLTNDADSHRFQPGKRVELKSEPER